MELRGVTCWIRTFRPKERDGIRKNNKLDRRTEEKKEEEKKEEEERRGEERKRE